MSGYSGWLYGKKSDATVSDSDADSDEKRARSNTSDDPNVEKEGPGDWVVKQSGTGIVLSHHGSKREAEAESRNQNAG